MKYDVVIFNNGAEIRRAIINDSMLDKTMAWIKKFGQYLPENNQIKSGGKDEN